jgi:hypothetical protein
MPGRFGAGCATRPNGWKASWATGPRFSRRVAYKTGVRYRNRPSRWGSALMASNVHTKGQRLHKSQRVTFLSDGGDTVRELSRASVRNQSTFWIAPEPFMNTDADLLERLSRSELYCEFQHAFGTSTGLPLRLRPREFWHLAHRGQPHEQPFCALITQTDQGCAAYLQAEQRAVEAAQERPATVRCLLRLVVIPRVVVDRDAAQPKPEYPYAQPYDGIILLSGMPVWYLVQKRGWRC